MSFPSLPVHAVGEGRVRTVVVNGVQVGLVTTAIPPGAFVPSGAVVSPVLVVVSIFRAETHPILAHQRVTRCA